MADDKELREKVDKLRNAGETFESIAEKIGVSGALIWKIARGKCSSVKARAYFGLAPRSVSVLPCMCGEVHTQKTCPNTRPKRKRYRVALEFDCPQERDEFVATLRVFGINRRKQSQTLKSWIQSNF